MKKKPKHFEQIKDYVLNRYGQHDDSPFTPKWVTVEKAAEELDLSEAEVQQSFHVLNIEGILGQATKSIRMGGDWHRDIYYLRKWNKRKNNGQ